MFCPLCQLEYRDGITKCGDCHLGLVTSREEARQSAAQLWKGARQVCLDKVLAALDYQAIPSHFRQIVNTSPRKELFGITVPSNQSTFEYEVDVLLSDLARARAAIADLDL